MSHRIVFTFCAYIFNSHIGGFHVTSSPPCWWTKTIDLSLAPFVRPPAFVHFTIVICVSRDWLKTTYSVAFSENHGSVTFSEIDDVIEQGFSRVMSHTKVA